VQQKQAIASPKVVEGGLGLYLEQEKQVEGGGLQAWKGRTVGWQDIATGHGD
jgi:hypothetical protein